MKFVAQGIQKLESEPESEPELEPESEPGLIASDSATLDKPAYKK